MVYSLPDPEQYLGNVSLLIVEDDALLADLLQRALWQLGFRNCKIAEHGAQALQILKYYSIDIMLCDWEMEPMDGIALTRYLRQHPQSPNRTVPIILMTGRTSVDDVRIARDSGITEFLAKPFDLEGLSQRLYAIVDKPRDFVLSKGFKGPDRRRRSSVNPSRERRKAIVKKVKSVHV